VLGRREFSGGFIELNHSMETYGGVAVLPHAFITLSLDGVSDYLQAPTTLPPGK
jgi:hypothetical protein